MHINAFNITNCSDFWPGSGQLEFEEFVTLAAQFLSEEEELDAAAMQEELKEAFRLYDKEGIGFKLLLF